MSSKLVKYEAKRIIPQVARALQSQEAKQVARAIVQHGPKVAKTVGKVVKWSYDQLHSFFGSKPKTAPGAGSGLGGYVSAPAATGAQTKGMNYSFHTAPNIGLGPGLRLIVSHRVPALVTGAVDGTNSSGFSNGTQYDPMLAFDPSLATVTGDHLSGQAIPCIFNGQTGLQSLSKMFERFLFRHCTIEFVPVQATSFAGAWAVGYYRDASRLDAQITATTGNQYNLALSVPNGQGGPNWELQCVNLFHIPDNTPVSMADAFYVHTEDSTSAGTSAGRFEVQGAAVIGYSGTTVGTVTHQPMAHTVLDLYCPAVDITGIQLTRSAERKALQKYIGSRKLEKLVDLLLKEKRSEKEGLLISGQDRKLSERKTYDDDDDLEVIDHTGPVRQKVSDYIRTPANTPNKATGLTVDTTNNIVTRR